jgi:hypothetical protein
MAAMIIVVSLLCLRPHIPFFLILEYLVLESDTFLHSWEMLARVLEDNACRDILIDVGMPVMVIFPHVCSIMVRYFTCPRLCWNLAPKCSLQLSRHMLQSGDSASSPKIVLG